MNTDKIKALVQNKQWRKLIDGFTGIDVQGNTVNHWQKTWQLPLDEKGCLIAHKLRGHLMQFRSYYDGVTHLGGKKFPALAIREATDVLETIDFIETNRCLLNEADKVFSTFFYNK